MALDWWRRLLHPQRQTLTNVFRTKRTAVLIWIGEIKYENCFELKIRDIRLSQLLVTRDRLLLTIPFLNLCCITSKYWFLFKIDCFVSTFYSTFLIFLIHLGLRPRRITSSEISIIFHMIRKPNSTIVLLFIQNNS